MQRARLLWTALIAILAISALAAATASANPTILPTPTEASPLTYEFTSESGSLETTKGLAIDCEKDKGKGNFTSNEAGAFEVDFEGCKERTSKAKCNTEGDLGGVILLAKSETEGRVVDVKNGTTLELAFLVTIKTPVKAKCGIVKFEIKGAVIALVDGPVSLVKMKKALLLFHQTKGEQAATTCELLEAICKGNTFKLESSTGGAFELAGLESDETITFASEPEIHF